MCVPVLEVRRRFLRWWDVLPFVVVVVFLPLECLLAGAR